MAQPATPLSKMTLAKRMPNHWHVAALKNIHVVPTTRRARKLIRPVRPVKCKYLVDDYMYSATPIGELLKDTLQQLKQVEQELQARPEQNRDAQLEKDVKLLMADMEKELQHMELQRIHFFEQALQTRKAARAERDAQLERDVELLTSDMEEVL